MVTKNLYLRVTQTGVQKAEAEMSRLGKATNAVMLKYLGWAAVIAGVVKLTKSSIDSYSRQELAIAKLSAAFGKSTKGLEAYASILQDTTMYADETTISAMAMIAAFVKEEEQIKRLIQAAADLAAMTGMGLSEAANLIAKSVGSSTNALARYGVHIEGIAKSTERTEMAIQSISDLMGGQAKKQAETYEGSVEQLANAWDDALESLGAFITYLLEKSGVFEFFTGVAKGLKIVLDDLFDVPKKGPNVWELALKSHQKYLASLEEAKKLENERLIKISDEILKGGMAELDVVGVEKRGPIDKMVFAAHDLSAGLKEVGKVAEPVFKEMLADSEGIVANWDAIAGKMVSSFEWAFNETLVRGENFFNSMAAAFEQMIAQMVASFMARSFVWGLMNLFTGGTFGVANAFLGFASGGLLEGGPAAISPFGGQSRMLTTINFNGPISNKRYIKQVVVPEIMKALR